MPKTLWRSFAAGEITPELLGRLDLAKFQTGLKTALNIEVKPHGKAFNRAGLQYILEAKDSTKKVRLIPFAYNTEQTFILEFGHQYVRFHTNGGTLLEASQDITDITKANPGVLTYSGADPSNGDCMFLDDIGGMTELNGRFVLVANVNSGANTFELTDLAGNNINTTSFGTYTSGGTMSRVYTVSTPYVQGDLFDLHYVQSADVLTITHLGYAPRELRRLGAANWTLTSISFVPTISAPTDVLATPTGSGSINYEYVVTSIAQDGLEESLASTADDCDNDLTVVGNVNTITWTTAANAVRYNVYKKLNGLYGYIGQASGTSFVDDNITPDVSITPANSNNPFSSDFPQAVSYFDQRRVFAGTTLKLQGFWATRSATESNLSYSIPTRDDDSITFRINARDVNAIRHIIPLTDLILLTAGGEWRVSPQNSDVLTPSTAAPKQISNEGASNVQPVLTGRAVIYVQEGGAAVREIAYRTDKEGSGGGYSSDDVTVLAPHLFEGYTIDDLAYAKRPHKTVWAVRSDGAMLGLTYLPEHSVAAWHKHTTDGEFESVATAKEGTEDFLYVVVKRTINGRTVRYIERKAARWNPTLDDLEDAFFVDSGLTYDGAAATVISGLYHLIGEQVSVLADGAVHPPLTVSATGSITLEAEASKVQIGLPYTSDIETLPLALEMEAYGQGTTKNISAVHLRLRGSSGVKAGPSFDKLREIKQRTTEPYGTPPAPLSGVHKLVIDASWAHDASVCVRQDQPLPLEVLAMTLEVAVGG